MDEDKMARKFIECKPEGIRSIGWSKFRWIDGRVRTLVNLELKDSGWSLGMGSHGGRSWGKPRLEQNYNTDECEKEGNS